jgi:glutamate-5-semialdehyde dehydrogenase
MDDQAPIADASVAAMVRSVASRSREASKVMAQASTEAKNSALYHAASALRDAVPRILAANRVDRDAGAALSPALLDRLSLDEGRIEAMARGLETVASLPDPVGRVSAVATRPNGLQISRVRVPLGVIGIVYESRPNVTADAAGIAIKSGNAVILRGGSEAAASSQAILAAMHCGLARSDLPLDAIQSLGTQDRTAISALLKLDDLVDLIVPRGGRSLIERVAAESRIPVLKHLDGICHVYIDGAADPEMARAVTLNAKMRRTGVCGAAETLLIDRPAVATHLLPVLDALIEAGCTIRGDAVVRTVDSRVEPATEADWSTEYLDSILSVRVVDGVEGAISHIDRYGSHHTESIITEDAAVAEIFLAKVDSAIVLWNASTQFADGGEFGMGAEIGISTGKLHARGPVGVEELTSYKYVVRGHGQLRP